MKRFYNLFLAMLLAMVAATPSFALEPLPETVQKGNFRCPQQLIVGGKKLFNSSFLGPNLVFRPSTTFGTTLDTTITATTPSAARTYTIPDAGANASFLMSAGTQVLAGTYTFPATGFKLLDSDGSHALTISAGDESANRAVTFPVLGGASSFVMTTSNQTIGGTKTFSTPPTITGGLTAANIQTGSAKRELLHYQFAGNVATHTAADSTVYSALLFPGRAGTVKNITWGVVTPPTVGTDTLKVLKGSSAGNTMLNAATFDANSLVANQATAATLTATGADLQVAATGANSGIYVEYSAGTQTVDAVDLSVTIEFEPDDF